MNDMIKAALMSCGTSVVITDNNIKDPRVIFANPAWSQMTGYDVNEIIGKNLKILQGPKTERSVIESLKKCINEQVSFRGRAFNYMKNGQPFILEWNIDPIFVDKELIGFISFQRNATTDYINETIKNTAIQEASKSEDMRKLILSNVSHELRTPLNIIIGYSELIKMKSSDKEIRDLCNFIETASSDLADKIKKISNIDNITKETIELNQSEECLCILVNEVLDECRNSNSNRNITFHKEFDHEHVKIYLDRNLIFNAIKEIVTNAIHFDINSSTVRTYIDANEEYVTLNIIDNGEGMTPNEINQAFKIFSQGDMEYTRIVNGLGIGLPYAKMIMEAHDGILELQSTKGLGTRVGLRFPINRVTIKSKCDNYAI